MTIIASDTFTRANASGWGTASDAETWAVVLGNVANFSIAGNEGQISGATSLQAAYLGSQTSADMEPLVRVSTSAILDTPIVLLRGTASNTQYRIGSITASLTYAAQSLARPHPSRAPPSRSQQAPTTGYAPISRGQPSPRISGPMAGVSPAPG